MTIEIIVELVWKSFVAAGLALLVLALMKKRSAAERSWIAHAGLIALLLLPVTVAAGPNWQVEAIPSIASPVPIDSAMHEPAVMPRSGDAVAPISQPSAAPVVEVPRLRAEAVLPWLYLVPAALLSLLLLVAVFRLYLLRGRSEVLVEPHWATALASAQRRMGFKHGTALLVSEELRSPISWGVVRPIILLDRRAAEDTEQAEAILAHELAHVVRLDWAMLLFGRLATALFWFNPLVWLLARRSHELAEQAVDDTVLRADIDNADYARLLIGTARHNNAAVLLAANGVAGSGNLTHRVERLLDASHSRRPAPWSWAVACCAGTFLVAAPLSALSPVRETLEFVGPSASSEADAVRSIGDKAGTAELPASTEGQALSSGAVQLAHARLLPSDTIALVDPRVTSRSASAPGASAPASPEATVAAPIKALDTLQSRDTQNSLSSLTSLTSLTSLKGLDSLSSLASLSSLPAGAVGRPRPRTARVKAPVIRDARPLLSAAWYGRTDVVKALLDAGTDIDATIGRGEGNALMKASRQGNLPLVKYLLDRGANINASVPGAGNALLQASHGGHEHVVRYLIARGAKVGNINKDESPLGSAAYMGHTNIVRILLAAGAGQESF